MLILERKDDETVLIYPSPNIAPDMTVAELFSQPIKIKAHCDESKVKVSIDVPPAFTVVRDELETA